MCACLPRLPNCSQVFNTIDFRWGHARLTLTSVPDDPRDWAAPHPDAEPHTFFLLSVSPRWRLGVAAARPDDASISTSTASPPHWRQCSLSVIWFQV
eukprot:scaffold10798_cov46-Attheya_sp.AAC.5